MLQEEEHSAILLNFIKLPFVFKTFVLSIFEWPLKTGFTIFAKIKGQVCEILGTYCVASLLTSLHILVVWPELPVMLTDIKKRSR